MTTDIKEFLLERIAEDETAARLAKGASPFRWQALNKGVMCNGGYIAKQTAWQSTADHITRFDPARVLAECAAKRAVIEDAASFADDYYLGFVCSNVLHTLTIPYRDHPEFNPEWSVA